jgi:hypothetical protein
MNCPTCNSAMVAEPAFLSVSWSCPECTRGEPTIGYVLVDVRQVCTLIHEPMRLMVFRDERAAVMSAQRMGREWFVYDVQFESAPTWHPWKLRPDDSVAWCEVRWNAKRNGLVGRQEKGA